MTSDEGGTAARAGNSECASDGIRGELRERAAGLADFGYRSAEAEFLAAAALLGGYFVRRQFRSYAGYAPGGAEVRLLRRAEAHGHAVPVAGKSLYRVTGADLCRSVGCEDSLSRRGAARRGIKRRLLALDYVLESESAGRWLLDQPTKAAHFESLGVPSDAFPASARTKAGRSRRFPDPLPIKAASGDHPAAEFCYAHSGESERGLNLHLARHEPLAAALHCRGIACCWAVLADSPGQFPRLRGAWRRWRARVLRDWEETDLFGLRLVVERREWSRLTKEDIDRYARLRSECVSTGVEKRYRKWLDRGAPPRQDGGDFAEACRYREVLLDHDYSVADKAA